jgi:hypothetical protein
VRPGQRVKARVTLRRARGGILHRSYRLRIPRHNGRGIQPLELAGVGVDNTDDSLIADIVLEVSGGPDVGREGPRSLRALAAQVRRIARYDGVSLRTGKSHTRGFRDPRLRISGVAHTVVRVVQRAKR